MFSTNSLREISHETRSKVSSASISSAVGSFDIAQHLGKGFSTKSMSSSTLDSFAHFALS